LKNRELHLSLFVAVLLHLLLLGTIILVIHPAAIKKAPVYIQSYFYDEEAAKAAPRAKPTPTPAENPLPTSRQGIEKPAKPQSVELNQVIRTSANTDSQPVHLVGDKKLDKPLLAILGKALTAHLVYPKIALDFNLRGVSIVGFTLSPDGRVSAVELLKSSQADLLDQAALSAVREMSPVSGVNTYISKPEPVVIGIIFG